MQLKLRFYSPELNSFFYQDLNRPNNTICVYQRGDKLYINHLNIMETTHLLIRMDVWTGEVDRTGREIYENDIYISSMDTPRLVKWSRSWDDCECAFAGWSFDVINPKYVTVVGNIHQNPELLTRRYLCS